MNTFCGADCRECNMQNCCNGCEATNGSPFGKKCFVAEYIRLGGKESFDELKKQLMAEFNSLKIDGMPEITELYCLCGSFINLEYPLPNGSMVKLLDDRNIYLGTQVKSMFADTEATKCFGLVAGLDFLLVSEYGIDGENPELVLFRRR